MSGDTPAFKCVGSVTDEPGFGQGPSKQVSVDGVIDACASSVIGSMPIAIEDEQMTGA